MIEERRRYLLQQLQQEQQREARRVEEATNYCEITQELLARSIDTTILYHQPQLHSSLQMLNQRVSRNNKQETTLEYVGVERKAMLEVIATLGRINKRSIIINEESTPKIDSLPPSAIVIEEEIVPQIKLSINQQRVIADEREQQINKLETNLTLLIESNQKQTLLVIAELKQQLIDSKEENEAIVRKLYSIDQRTERIEKKLDDGVKEIKEQVHLILGVLKDQINWVSYFYVVILPKRICSMVPPLVFSSLANEIPLY